MGGTVHFRGRLEDLTLLEPLEDCVIDLSLALGGRAQIWRSTSDSDPNRCVKGVLWEIAPGSETFALLFSPEGWLIPLRTIEDAEEGRLDEQPWVFVKTQYAPPEAHVILIESLKAIRSRFIPDLEVQDEGGYWETQDLQGMLRKRQLIEGALDGMQKALENDGLSPEAREDPDILATRITRLAAMVHETLERPSEHPPARIRDDQPPWADAKGTEAEWDAFYAEQRRKQERVQRRVEEALAKGSDPAAALRSAFESEGIGIQAQFDQCDADEASFEDTPEPATEPCSSKPFSPVAGPLDQDPHPLQQRATTLLLRVLDIIKSRPIQEPDPLGDVEATLLDVCGGLAQALTTCDEESDGWALVQLKRALRGAAFARGALFRAKGVARLNQDDFDQLRDVLEGIEGDLIEEMRDARRSLGEP